VSAEDNTALRIERLISAMSAIQLRNHKEMIRLRIASLVLAGAALALTIATVLTWWFR
jgi:hypothetical protein